MGSNYSNLDAATNNDDTILNKIFKYFVKSTRTTHHNNYMS